MFRLYNLYRPGTGSYGQVNSLEARYILYWTCEAYNGQVQSKRARYSFYWPGTASICKVTCFWGTGTEATTGTVSQVCTKKQVHEGGAERETGTGGRIRYRMENQVQEGETGPASMKERSI